jgi:hypothetical protein
MKKSIVPLLMIFVLLLVALPASAAVPAPGGPFSTAFRVQNLDATDVTCEYTFYSSDGATAYSSGTSPAIHPGDSLFVYTPNVSGLSDGTYSGVVSCTGEVGAVANFSDANSGASFNGISSPASEWFAPGIYDNYFNYYSAVVAQNATGSPVDITLDVYAPGSSIPVYTKTQSNVPAYASASFEQEGLTELVTNQPYSAKISATGDIAPVVTVYGLGSANEQLYSYNPFPSGATTMYAPVVMNNYFGYNSALVIQNMGNVTTHVKVDYSTGHSQEQDVAAGASWSIYVPVQGPSGIPSGNSNGLFSAVVTSTGTGGDSAQNIAVLVNESNSYNRAASFIGSAGGSSEVRAPALEKRYFNYNSSVTCQMISGGPATMTIEYFDASGSLGTVVSPSIGNGKTHLFYQPNDMPGGTALPNDWLGSAKITSSGQISCVVNQDMNEGTFATTSMDQLFAYEGIAP